MQKENQLKSCYKIMLSSREVVARDLPHPTMLSLLNRKQQPYSIRDAEDPAQKPCGMTNLFNNGNICPTLYSVQKHYGMTSVGRGFTLIELLVVVLIIGILASVALPQYQKAVEKSRAAQGLAVLRAVYEAQKAYYLANGSYATKLDELSVDVPWTGKTGWSTGTMDRYSNDDWALELYKNSIKDQAVMLGRLRGKYAGGSFGFVLANPGYDWWPTDELLCFERTGNGVIFEGNAGDYCQKLFKATYLGKGGAAMRVYTMP